MTTIQLTMLKKFAHLVAPAQRNTHLQFYPILQQFRMESMIKTLSSSCKKGELVELGADAVLLRLRCRHCESSLAHGRLTPEYGNFKW
jgi:hypothetical protein